MVYRRILLVFVLACLALGIEAQKFAMPVVPVRWKAEVVSVNANTAKVNLTAAVTKGWHLYDLTLPDGGPKPTLIDFSGSRGVKVTGKPVPSVAPLKVHDDMFDMELTQWNAPVTFAIPVRLEGSGEHILEIKVTYMACDGNNCRPPKTETITVSIP